MQPHTLSLLHLCWTRLFISLIFAGGIYSAGMHIIGVSAWVGLRWFISYILIHKCTAYTLHKSHVSLSLSHTHTHTHTHHKTHTIHPPMLCFTLWSGAGHIFEKCPQWGMLMSSLLLSSMFHFTWVTSADYTWFVNPCFFYYYFTNRYL